VCSSDLLATDDEKIVIMDEFRFIVDLEMELIMSNTSVKRKLVHLKRIRPKDDPLVTKKIVILEKMQVLEELLTPVSKSLQLPLPVKKICPEGKHLNPVTNRCNKDKKNVTQKICPEGQHLNPVTNRCNKDKAKTKNVTKKICPEGKHLNVKTNRCNKDKKVQTI
jgi:hypothetical protein